MYANSLHMIMIPIVVAIGLGAALGMVGLAALRLAEAVAGLGRGGRRLRAPWLGAGVPGGSRRV